MSSAFEAFIARCATVEGSAAVATTVNRRRPDAYAPDELPAIEILRGEWSAAGQSDSLDVGTGNMRMAFIVRQSASAEAELDALHQAAHVALFSDSEITTRFPGLRCESTAEPEEVATGEGVFARMEAVYSVRTINRRASLAKP